MKIVCYKAIFHKPGDTEYDKLYPPECPTDGVEFVCFKDVPEPRVENGWQVIPAFFEHLEYRRRSRKHKALAHVLFPDADYTLWLDGVFTPIVSPLQLVEQYGKHLLVTHRHPARSCLYQEAKAVIARKKDNPNVVRRQIERYREHGVPTKLGLAETGALLRRHCSETEHFNTCWWGEINAWSCRDQISFDAVRWFLKFPAVYFPGTGRKSPFFRWRPHHH